MSDENKSLSQQWEAYKPTKGLWLWSCIGVAALTMLLGFTVGGWVLGGTAQEMAEKSAEQAKAEVVATVCVENFSHSAGFATSLAALKETSRWQRDDFITDGGWVTLPGMTEPHDAAADLCASRLADIEAPATDSTDAADAGTKG